MKLQFRPVQADDLPQIAIIYNHAVHNTAATFDIDPKTPSDFTVYLSSWDTSTRPNLYRMLVATLPAPHSTIVAYAGISPFKPRAAYDQTAEVMLYVHPEHQSRGYGMKLLRRMHDEQAGVLAGVHTTLSIMNSENVTTRKMFEKLGYVHRGELVDVGWKFGRRWSVVIYQLIRDGEGQGQGHGKGGEGDGVQEVEQ